MELALGSGLDRGCEVGREGMVYGCGIQPGTKGRDVLRGISV